MYCSHTDALCAYSLHDGQCTNGHITKLEAFNYLTGAKIWSSYAITWLALAKQYNYSQVTTQKNLTNIITENYYLLTYAKLSHQIDQVGGLA